MMAAPSLKVLLANSIDYAGMFPPCSLRSSGPCKIKRDMCARPIDVERLRYRRSKVGALHLNRPILSHTHTHAGRLRSIALPTVPLKSFIDVPPRLAFPIQNLPFGVFEPRQRQPRVGVAIGDLIVDLSVLDPSAWLRSLPPAISAMTHRLSLLTSRLWYRFAKGFAHPLKLYSS